jgi:membrane-anchored protein YejM (alkaline phosphatase superfamily)
MKSAGYNLMMVSSANMNWNRFLTRITGSHGLLDTFYSPYETHRDKPRNDLDTMTIDQAKKCIEQAPRNKPYMLFVQLDSTHWTYFPDKTEKRFTPSVDTINMFGLTNNKAIIPVYNKYRNSVRTVDQRIGTLFDFLKKRGEYDNTVIVVVSDHGDGFAPGRIGHSVLHDDIRRIYAAIQFPGRKAEKYTSFIQHTDIFPTIFSYLEINGSWRNYVAGESIFDKSIGSKPRLIFHGSLRMADLVYNGKSVRFMTRVKDGKVYGNPVFEYDGKDLNSVKKVDINNKVLYNAFIEALR